MCEKYKITLDYTSENIDYHHSNGYKISVYEELKLLFGEGNYFLDMIIAKDIDLYNEVKSKFNVNVVTQNVDDFHERAGSKNVLHLHGEIMKVRSEIDPELIYPVKNWELKIDSFARIDKEKLTIKEIAEEIKRFGFAE